MNPYFEQTAHWQDFHIEFLSTLRRALAPQVVPKYIVQLEEHIYIHDVPQEARRRIGRADLSLARREGASRFETAVGVLDAPSEVQLPDQDVERVPYLEIRDRSGHELVTVIELLSPSNKRPGDDREQYLDKRRELLRSPVHLVEIDLLRGWEPMPLDDRPACDYSVMISVVDRRPKADFWGVSLRNPLPTIPIPLRNEDGVARIELQDVLHRTYDGPGYEHFLYDGSPEPPLSSEDRKWAEPFVPSR